MGRAAFLAAGEHEVLDVFAALDAWGIEVPRGRALDFGCGVGRLTLALASRFDAVVGVDLSAAMLENARRLAGGRVEDRRRETPALLGEERGGFDVVLSFIALQHVSSRTALVAYVDALTQALRPGGVGAPQVPARVPRRVRLHPVRLLGRAAPGLVLRRPRRFDAHLTSLTAALVDTFVGAGASFCTPWRTIVREATGCSASPT